jgi:hypothetical protein
MAICRFEYSDNQFSVYYPSVQDMFDSHEIKNEDLIKPIIHCYGDDAQLNTIIYKAIQFRYPIIIENASIQKININSSANSLLTFKNCIIDLININKLNSQKTNVNIKFIHCAVEICDISSYDTLNFIITEKSHFSDLYLGNGNYIENIEINESTIRRFSVNRSKKNFIKLSSLYICNYSHVESLNIFGCEIIKLVIEHSHINNLKITFSRGFSDVSIEAYNKHEVVFKLNKCVIDYGTVSLSTDARLCIESNETIADKQIEFDLKTIELALLNLDGSKISNITLFESHSIQKSDVFENLIIIEQNPPPRVRSDTFDWDNIYPILLKQHGSYTKLNSQMLNSSFWRVFNEREMINEGTKRVKYFREMELKALINELETEPNCEELIILWKSRFYH